ncbi:hypothetical protein DLAC_10017 [Tieghemostelium lacteum]|uniref:Transmembrane protein n=1 Tax=Tieghemostelium lacteum TaxID=361077 RepID=A0A151Z6D3_TIELA|nr:hypothetical protein DLAC_10017 [Tieghemostelium lacteum]|eukprot:KYQ89354.1 hypothetical protein DLAC_10017 [Tieghemostelium lacteum]
MANVKNIIPFVIFGVAWVLLIVSYSSYWYYSRTNPDSDTTYTISYFKHDQLKVYAKVGGQSATAYHSWTSDEKENNKNSFAIANAALAFTIISWVVDTAVLFFLLLSIIGVLSKIPLPMGIFTRILAVVAVLCSLLGLLIFLGYPNGQLRDCKAQYDSDLLKDACDQVPQYKNFAGSDDNVKWGPSTGWIILIIATALNLVGCITTGFIAQF